MTKQEALTEAATPVEQATLADKYIELKKQIDALEKEQAALAAEIKAGGAAEWVGTRGIVRVAEVAGRKTVDWKQVQTFVRIPEDVLQRCTNTSAAGYRMTVHPL